MKEVFTVRNGVHFIIALAALNALASFSLWCLSGKGILAIGTLQMILDLHIVSLMIGILSVGYVLGRVIRRFFCPDDVSVFSEIRASFTA